MYNELCEMRIQRQFWCTCIAVLCERGLQLSMRSKLRTKLAKNSPTNSLLQSTIISHWRQTPVYLAGTVMDFLQVSRWNIMAAANQRYQTLRETLFFFWTCLSCCSDSPLFRAENNLNRSSLFQKV